MMKFKRWMTFFLGLFFYLKLFAAAPDLPILRVATDQFAPPFLMRGANNQLFGFDIEMMENLCKIIQRKCVYYPMPLEQIFKSIQDKSVDLGVGAITITLDRSKLVSFSIPYLLSYAQYIGLNIKNPILFSINQLENKKVGVIAGSIFINAIQETGLNNINVVEMANHEKIIQALEYKKIDFALVDAPTAQFWKAQSNNLITPLGKPFLYGYGLGIALNLSNPELLEDINSALLQYQNNGGFQRAYSTYIQKF